MSAASAVLNRSRGELWRTGSEKDVHHDSRRSFPHGDDDFLWRSDPGLSQKDLEDPQEDGTIDERGVRYGENPDQEAALYELVNGNLMLGDCTFIEPGNGLVCGITVEDMLQVGKHPGKINLTDIDNGLNILKYLMDRPAAVILKHNNPCGAAYGETLADAFDRANRCDRIAAFGGAVIMSRPCDNGPPLSCSAATIWRWSAPRTLKRAAWRF